MKILQRANTVIDGTVTFVLKILGAFGACWGSFSAASVGYREFFGGPKDADFMENPAYAKTALAVSLSAATLSAYVIVRDKFEAYRSKAKSQEVDVTIPLCHSFNNVRQIDRSNQEMEELVEDIMLENGNSNRAKPMQVVCKIKTD